MFLRRNTSTNKLSILAPAPLLALGPAGCGEASRGRGFLEDACSRSRNSAHMRCGKNCAAGASSLFFVVLTYPISYPIIFLSHKDHDMTSVCSLKMTFSIRRGIKPSLQSWFLWRRSRVELRSGESPLSVIEEKEQ